MGGAEIGQGGEGGGFGGEEVVPVRSDGAFNHGFPMGFGRGVVYESRGGGEVVEVEE